MASEQDVEARILELLKAGSYDEAGALIDEHDLDWAAYYERAHREQLYAEYDIEELEEEEGE